MYIVRCADDTLYTGWTNDLRARLLAHNGGRGAKYTKTRRPVVLAYAEAFADRREAMRREYEVKQLTRQEKEGLIIRSGREWKLGKIYYLMGKSATGKDHIYEKLLADEALGLRPLIIYTTRPMRGGETQGVEYHFTDEAHLRKLEEEGKVVECRTYQSVYGPWYYFTVDDENIDLTKESYLGIGTLVSFTRLCDWYGRDRVIPLYVEVEDGMRLERALKRERKQKHPGYEEMCRRFLADQADFTEEAIREAGIQTRFQNEKAIEDCIGQIRGYILAENADLEETRGER